MSRLKKITKVSEQLTPEQAITEKFAKPGRRLFLKQSAQYTGRANTFTSASTKAKCKAIFMSTDCSLTSICNTVGIGSNLLRRWFREEQWQKEKELIAIETYNNVIEIMKQQVENELTASFNAKLKLIEQGASELSNCMSNVFQQLNKESLQSDIDHKKMVNLGRVLKDLVSIGKDFGMRFNAEEDSANKTIAKFESFDAEIISEE